MPSGQATAVAVQAVHADVAAAGAAMVARLEATSAKLAAAAVSFTDQETSSAAEVAAVAPTSTWPIIAVASGLRCGEIDFAYRESSDVR